jgi:amidohydrolase
MDLRSRAQAIQDDLVAIRRAIHQRPELSGQERETAALVAGRLRDWGIEVREGVGGTGVVGMVRGKLEGGTVGLRADMDALPITEANRVPYCSEREGVMHACGHDAHVACVLGAARLLVENAAALQGNVKLVFQPHEEIPPGGAQAMIAEGVLDNPPVSAMVALHCDSSLPVGKVGVKAGPILAAADEFTLSIQGESGHAALPHNAVDAIVAASEVITALQTIASRRVDPLSPVVVTVGTIHGGVQFNVICDRVTMEGTARTLDPQLTEAMPSMIESVVAGAVQVHGARFELDYRRGYPVTMNDSAITDIVSQAVRSLLGDGALCEVRELMGGEDFAYFAQNVPSCFFRLGIRNEERGIVYPLHHPHFDLDEAALSIGAAVLTQSAWSLLGC